MLDFLLFENEILLLTYHGSFTSRGLKLIDYDGNILSEKSLKGIKKIEGLHKSCLGGMHLLIEFEVFQVFYDEESLILASPFSRKKYENLMWPCVLANADYVYYEIEKHKGQNLSFAAMPKDGSQPVHFGLAMNANNVRLYYEELYFLENQL